MGEPLREEGREPGEMTICSSICAAHAETEGTPTRRSDEAVRMSAAIDCSYRLSSLVRTERIGFASRRSTSHTGASYSVRPARSCRAAPPRSTSIEPLSCKKKPSDDSRQMARSAAATVEGRLRQRYLGRQQGAWVRVDRGEKQV
eukprot:scaffold121957_cov28-Tisochrysis_lutea.AAC.2